MEWYVGTTLGAFLLVFINTYERLHGMGDWKTYVVIIPALIVMNQLFWFGFSRAPSFLQAWFIGTGLCAVIAWAVSAMYLKEPFDMYHMMGAIIVVIGTALLQN